MLGAVLRTAFWAFWALLCELVSRRWLLLRGVAVVKLVSLLFLLFVLLEAIDCSSCGEFLVDPIGLLLGLLEAVGRVELVIRVSLKLEVLKVIMRVDRWYLVALKIDQSLDQC